MKVVAKPIDAIVVFKGAEKPLPYKFRYTPSQGNSVDITVGKILTAEEQRIAGIRTYVYDCQSIVDGVEKRYQLKYSIGDCRWILYKI